MWKKILTKKAVKKKSIKERKNNNQLWQEKNHPKIVTKLKNSNCDKTQKSYKTQKLKLWEKKNSTTEIVTKLPN